MRTAWFGLGLALIGGTLARADDGPAPEPRVLPLLKARCVKCHGPAKREAKLSLATPRSLARGGEEGAVVVPGAPEESLLWERVEADEMPPDDPLSGREKAALRAWIADGAPGLPTVSPDEPEGADHWAFAPPRRPDPPAVHDASRARSPIDQFLLAALEARGLNFAPEADRATLIRRVSFDLTGLPPTPDEIGRFLDDPAPDAYERMVERYLASPRYGERWGKYWLDASGYADSNGYFDADTDRPLAYKYRDYVIRSWDADRPIDRFLVEQIAGDELAGFRPGGTATPEVADLLVATHFLRNAPDGTGESDGNPDEMRADRFAVLEGTTQVIGSALLGLTLQCARCHDHKFEPVTQRDYYSLYAILWPAFDPDAWLKPNERVVEAPSPEERAAWRARNRRIDAEVAGLRAEFAAWAERNRPEGVVIKDDMVVIEDRLSSAEPWSAALTGAGFAEEISARRKALDAAVAERDRRRGDPPGRIAWVTDFCTMPPETPLLKRGLYTAPGPAVAPGPPAILVDPDDPYEVRDSAEGMRTTGRRLAFARWMTRPGSRPSALLARVTVNRIWQGHFGTGLVATPENLGYSGAPPSHPELLDYLAAEFARGGWRAKSLHRRIVNSSAYRQASAPRPEADAIDPDARLLGRYPMRRLDAEAIRDAMLAASGELDLRMGGPYVPAARTDDGEVVVAETTDGARRRSVYLQQRRTRVVSLLEVFDAPSLVTACTRRSSSTIPLQSLSLLNSAFVAARARAMAFRLDAEAGPDAGRKVARAFLLAIGRPPDEEERAAARRFLEAQPARYAGRGEAEARAWADLCQMILASNAFLYLE